MPDAAVQAMGPGSWWEAGFQGGPEGSRRSARVILVDPRAKAELVGNCVRPPLEVIVLNYGSLSPKERR